MILLPPTLRQVASLGLSLCCWALTRGGEAEATAAPPGPSVGAAIAPEGKSPPAKGEPSASPHVEAPSQAEVAHPAPAAPVEAPAKAAAGAPPEPIAKSLPAAPHQRAAGTKVQLATRDAEARGLIALGNRLTERGDYPAAEIAYRQILGASKEFSDADVRETLLALGRMHRLQGAYTKAAAIYERFLKDYPEDGRVPDALLDLGRTLRAMGASKMALNRFYSVINSTLKVQSENFEHYQLLAKTAQFEIAETHFASGEYAEAGKFFARLRLLDLAPADRARAHFKSAYALQLAGDDEAAIKTLLSYLEQWPKDENVPEARYLLATTLRRLNHPNEALAATMELLRGEQAVSGADAKRWSYWQRRTGNQLANDFFQQGDTMNALAIYQGLVALAPEPAWRLPVTYQMALCYERLRLADRARNAYQSIVDGVAALGNGKSPAPVPADLTELAHMAAWRLGNLDWTDRTDHQLTVFFSSTTGQHPVPATPVPASAPAAARP